MYPPGVAELLNPRSPHKDRRSGKQTPLEQRFYTAAPRFEESLKRACGKSVILLRSELAISLVRGLEDLEHDYVAARTDSMAQSRPVADMEARYGAAIVLVHLQVLAKVNELEELATSGTPVLDIARLADNLSGLTKHLAAIEAAMSIAITGDLNEEERNKIRFYDTDRFVRMAEAVQLRREAQAAAKRLTEGKADPSTDLAERARARLSEIQAACDRLASEADLSKEVQLDQILKQISPMLAG